MFLAIACLALSACVTPGPSLTDGAPVGKRGDAPLDFTLPRFDGQPYSLKSDRGSVVLLDVWATWCDPCRDAMPLYQDLLKEYGGRGLKVYAISVDTDTKMIPPFLAETKVDLPVLLDPAGAFAESALKVKVMPTAFLIDRQGVLRVTHEGFDEGLLATWVKDVEALLAEPAR
ncbi:MAG: TlpA family protein disulfide reductase [Myxococcales bacterium]|nr:TlpA family protein disulfide reductase [Myxococcales bacterium]